MNRTIVCVRRFFPALPSAGLNMSAVPSASFFQPPNSTEEEEEDAVRDNISTLLDSIASVSRGSVFTSRKYQGGGGRCVHKP